MFTYGVRAHDFGQDTVDELFKKIKGYGIETLQLAYKKAIKNINHYEDINEDIIKETNSALEKNNLSVGILGFYVEPSYVDNNLRKKSVEEFLYGIPIAKKINAGCIGTETTNMNKQPNVTRGEAIESLKKFLYEILPVAEESNVIVGVEPVFYHGMATPELTREILDSMKSENLKVIFDPVNLFAPDDLNNQHSLWDRAFYNFGEDIIAVHMKGIKIEDNKLIKANFKESVIDYKYIFKQLKALKKDLPIFREEGIPSLIESDIDFLKQL